MTEDELRDECSNREIWNLCMHEELKHGTWYGESRSWVRDRIQKNEQIIQAIQILLDRNESSLEGQHADN